VWRRVVRDCDAETKGGSEARGLKLKEEDLVGTEERELVRGGIL